jgi:N-acetylglucosaminyldiphosphoundecaprenol N-acetyl-beta-D-mannosaminyltransferase
VAATDFMFGPVKCSTHSIADLLMEIRFLLVDSSAYPRSINCLNAHILNAAWQNDALARTLNRSRIVAADGMSIVWAALLFRMRIRERCNMTEAFRVFMKDRSFPPKKAILIGGSDRVATLASAEINRLCSHTTVIDSLSGYLCQSEYEQYLQHCEPVDFILLGLGTPKSEFLSEIASAAMPQAIVWHIGGGTLLFLSGDLSEAPAWMRHSGLQWLHRLMLEPARMWQRYLVGNTLFVFRCFYWLIKKA